MAGHRPKRGAIGTVVATPAAVDAILRLRARHRTIAFRPTANRPDSTVPSSLTEAELPPRINDLQLGEIGGVPFLVDAGRYRRWGCPDLVVDVPEDDNETPPVGGDGDCRLTLHASR